MTVERRRDHPPAFGHLVDALDHTIVVDPGPFVELVDGLLELRSRVPVTPSLILARPPEPALDAPQLVTSLVVGNVRSFDVMSWVDARTVAILLDAGPADAFLVTRRVLSLLTRSFRFRPAWAGVTTAAGAATSAAEMFAAAAVALDRAVVRPDGAIEVVAS